MEERSPIALHRETVSTFRKGKLDIVAPKAKNFVVRRKDLTCRRSEFLFGGDFPAVKVS